ncbi:FecR domain-containing protein [Dyadobacter sp. CY261]|uniref:FecR family protein n=1 Tax=Dyadobacter sp. CY261 TaxID=2907203 RepID=UPI001F3A821F|nr:FecR family protein [Dyadobacter sp. CY261]MCF0070738.1 FecR domain-containing protein [Dyadobacter sp. CY261]
MHPFYHYNLEDFLTDDDFRLWVKNGQPRNDFFWAKLRSEYPEKALLMDQATELILTWEKQPSDLTHEELDHEVNRILNESVRTMPVRKTGIIQLRWWYAAASVLVLVGIGWLISRGGLFHKNDFTYKRYVSASAVPLKEIVNQSEKPMVVNLPDGSEIRLMPDAAVSYAPVFIQNHKREVYLSGEAFFDVKKDKANPFFVYANDLVTRVVGTSFTIKSSSERVEVIVRTGKVAVMQAKDLVGNEPAHEMPGTAVLLTPNQQIVFTAQRPVMARSITENPVAIARPVVKPDFTFDNQPVGEAFKLLQETYGIPILYDSARLENCYLRVALRDEPFFDKLGIICSTIEASYQITDGQVVIKGQGCE